MPRLDFFSIRWKVAHIFPLECTGLFGSHLHVRTPKISWIVQQVTVWKLWRWNLQWVWQVKNSRRFNWIHYSSSILATWQCMTTTTLEWSFVEIMRNTVRSNHVKSLQFDRPEQVKEEFGSHDINGGGEGRISLFVELYLGPAWRSNLLLPASKNAGETFKFAQLPTATGRSKRRNVDLRTRHPTQSGRRPEPPPQSWEKNFRDARNQLVIAATSESTMSHNRNSRSQILPEVQLVVEKSEEIRIFHKIFKFSTRTLIKFGSKDLSSTLKESDVRVSANLFF